jgi:hypothetical protein
MDSVLRRGALAAAVATAAFAGTTGAAEAMKIRGTVVHHNRGAHSFVVAGRHGHLYAIHARRAPRVGRHVVLTARRLRNGTFRLQRLRSSARTTRHVRVRGVVSWVNRRKAEFTVSAPGVSMLVRSARRGAARAADALPPVGTNVVVTGTVDDQGDVEDQSVQDEGTDSTGVDLEGQVLSVDPVGGTITVSADDEDQTGSSIVVDVPSTFDITQFTPGEEVELLVQPNGDGTVTLLGSSDDSNAQGADDQGDQQGEDPGDQGDQGDQAGSDDGGSTDGTSGSDGGSTTSTGGGD